MIVALVAFSCSNKELYFRYTSLPEQGWNKDSMYNFDVQVTDTVSPYAIYVNVRNRNDYPYQNLWLFLRLIDPNRNVLRDTINFYLADQRGKWLGAGAGSLYEMPVIYKQSFHFSRPGKYTFGIVQGMRDSVLTGINDIGLRIEKIGNR